MISPRDVLVALGCIIISFLAQFSTEVDYICNHIRVNGKKHHLTLTFILHDIWAK